MAALWKQGFVCWTCLLGKCCAVVGVAFAASGFAVKADEAREWLRRHPRNQVSDFLTFDAGKPALSEVAIFSEKDRSSAQPPLVVEEEVHTLEADYACSLSMPSRDRALWLHEFVKTGLSPPKSGKNQTFLLCSSPVSVGGGSFGTGILKSGFSSVTQHFSGGF